jgi:hypothetical protein
MASSLSDGTLTVTIDENIAFNTAGYDSSVSNSSYQTVLKETYTGVNEIYNTIATASTSPTTFLSIDSARSAGTLILGDLKYLRVTNLDNSVELYVELSDGSNDYIWLKLRPGQSYIMSCFTSAIMGGNAMSSITAVRARSASSTVDFEILAASG